MCLGSEFGARGVCVSGRGGVVCSHYGFQGASAVGDLFVVLQ